MDFTHASGRGRGDSQENAQSYQESAMNYLLWNNTWREFNWRRDFFSYSYSYVERMKAQFFQEKAKQRRESEERHSKSKVASISWNWIISCSAILLILGLVIQLIRGVLYIKELEQKLKEEKEARQKIQSLLQDKEAEKEKLVKEMEKEMARLTKDAEKVEAMTLEIKMQFQSLQQSRIERDRLIAETQNLLNLK
jgi:uncharacterized protein HemX